MKFSLVVNDVVVIWFVYSIFKVLGERRIECVFSFVLIIIYLSNIDWINC